MWSGKHLEIITNRLPIFTTNAEEVKDFNIVSHIYKEKIDIQNIVVQSCQGILPFSQIVNGSFSPTSVGETFGPSW
jgi:hypothetical protein